MPRITFDNVRKNFGKSVVIEGFSADIADGEFLVLLGPSGCGKSTMLRMIAGLTDTSEGDISFDGESVNALEPRERNIAFVFQSYALYPHMSVLDNIAFPLIMDRFKPWYHLPILNSIVRRMIRNSPEVKDRVLEVAKILELEPLLDRRPRTLSGGQRQRVAVARALVRDPEVYLLDEPLSNLDAKLRTQMRAEITGLYRKVKKTFIYVTHDQVEAMTMASRIIVMDEGVIRQIGTPEEIYHSPADTFVARFIGSPPMNLIPGAVMSDRVVLPGKQELKVQNIPSVLGGQTLVGVRPETIRIASSAKESVRATVVSVENLGAETVLGFVFCNDANSDSLLTRDNQSTFFAKLEGSHSLTEGAEIFLTIDTTNIRWFDPDSGSAFLDLS